MSFIAPNYGHQTMQTENIDVPRPLYGPHMQIAEDWMQNNFSKMGKWPKCITYILMDSKFSRANLNFGDFHCTQKDKDFQKVNCIISEMLTRSTLIIKALSIPPTNLKPQDWFGLFLLSVKVTISLGILRLRC